MTKKKSDGADNKAAPKKQSPTANDPWYSKVTAESGEVVSGGAALLVRTKAMGGQSAIIHKVAEAAVKEATQAATAAYVKTQSDGVIGFPKQKRKSK